MTLILLLDLDDTLLEANMDTFIPAYFQALSGALSALVESEVMLPALMSGTKRMMVNNDPGMTLRQIFDAHFFPALNLEREALQVEIDRFYDEIFPTLKYLTKPRPEAVRLVDWAFEKGYRVVIATNPLFPLKAIHHRLRWAGLPPEKYPFALVSSYESFHFTKESVAYFSEVLGQLGWPEAPVIMAGNDLNMDLLPAVRAGFPAYWIDAPDGKQPKEVNLPYGSLDQFHAWLETVDIETLMPTFKTPESLLALLRSSPAAFSSFTGNLLPQEWLAKPRPGEWCITEIICHLRDVEQEVNLTRIRKVLAEDNPPIVGEVTDRWAEERQYVQQNGCEALINFTNARKEALTILGDLTSEWQRRARHTIFGPTSLQELVGFVAEHDRVHVQQVAAAKTKQG